MTLVDENLDWDYAFTKRLDLKAKITLKCVPGCRDMLLDVFLLLFFQMWTVMETKGWLQCETKCKTKRHDVLHVRKGCGYGKDLDGG